MNVDRLIYRYTLAFLSLGCILLLLLFSVNDSGASQAKAPFGVTAPAAPAPIGGDFLRENLSWIYQQQAVFYKTLTDTVKEAKSDLTVVWFLVGLSFLYGVFHAAGPGHGKIVISTYVLANEQSAKRGMIISFIAAFLQGLVAVLFIGAAIFLFSFSSFEITKATSWFERASYSLITILGFYLLWQKGVQPYLRNQALAAQSISDKPIVSSQTFTGDGQLSDHHNHHEHLHDHSHHGCSCSGHAVDPSKLKDPLSPKSAWAAIASVGLRPCSGALIVLVFCSAQGLFWVGVASSFAMALGTGITITSLATIALGAKGLVTKYLSVSSASSLVFKSLEVLGASLIFLLGITLLAASMQL